MPLLLSQRRNKIQRISRHAVVHIHETPRTRVVSKADRYAPNGTTSTACQEKFCKIAIDGEVQKWRS